MNTSVVKYPLAIITLHWVTAILMAYAMYSGMVQMPAQLKQIPQDYSSPEYLNVVGWHILVAFSIGVLTIGRIIIRWTNQLPTELDIGIDLANKLARPYHYLLYIVVIALLVTGVAAFNVSGTMGIVFSLEAPKSFWYASMSAHRFIGGILLPILLGLHVLAALYHQFIVRNRIFGRMWWF